MGGGPFLFQVQEGFSIIFFPTSCLLISRASEGFDLEWYYGIVVAWRCWYLTPWEKNSTGMKEQE